MTDAYRFPDGFLWGSATSAYQIEGSPLADGAGPSIWQRFAHTPGMTHNGETGDVACDHYHRYRDDVALMASLGLQAYRFSIAWARVLPAGTGPVNPAGLDFYDRLVDALLEKGIEPLATLYHWDLPAALDDRGGWLNRDIAGWFADYAEIMFARLDGRVKKWATLNEPWVVTDGGYLHGALAPGHRNLFEAPIASRNLMRAHGAAVQRYRAVGANQIGLVVNLEPKYPRLGRRGRSCRRPPLARLHEPPVSRSGLRPRLPRGARRDIRRAPGPTGATRIWRWPPADRLPRRQLLHARRDEARPGAARCASRLCPPAGKDLHRDRLGGLRAGPHRRPAVGQGALRRPPLYVTENGAAFYDPPTAQEKRVRDPLRVDYLQRHLRAVHAADRAGVDVRGYMAWSLIDNLEWSLGFSKRFGIVHVDFATQQRTPKDSALYYSRIVATNGAALAGDPWDRCPEPGRTPAGSVLLAGRADHARLVESVRGGMRCPMSTGGSAAPR